MKKTIEVINALKTENVIDNYAIGGAMAALRWVEPFFTRDLDIFIELIHESSENEIIDLSPIYNHLKKKGYDKWIGQWIIIEGIPVEFIPAVGLSKEALQHSVVDVFEGVEARIMTPEYLISLFLLAGRDKDKLKIKMLLEQTEINMGKLKTILGEYGLRQKFEQLLRGVRYER